MVVRLRMSCKCKQTDQINVNKNNNILFLFKLFKNFRFVRYILERALILQLHVVNMYIVYTIFIAKFLYI